MVPSLHQRLPGFLGKFNEIITYSSLWWPRSCCSNRVWRFSFTFCTSAGSRPQDLRYPAVAHPYLTRGFISPWFIQMWGPLDSIRRRSNGTLRTPKNCSQKKLWTSPYHPLVANHAYTYDGPPENEWRYILWMGTPRGPSTAPIRCDILALANDPLGQKP